MLKLLELSANNRLLDKICKEAGETTFCYTNTAGDVILFLPEFREEMPELASQVQDFVDGISRATTHDFNASQWVKFSA